MKSNTLQSIPSSGSSPNLQQTTEISQKKKHVLTRQSVSLSSSSPPISPTNNRILQNKNSNFAITNATLGQLQHLRLTEKLESLNSINSITKIMKQNNTNKRGGVCKVGDIGRSQSQRPFASSQSTQLFSQSDIFRQNEAQVKQNYLTAAVCGQKVLSIPKSPLSPHYRQMKMAQRVKSLIEFQSAQNIMLNKPEVVRQREMISHIKPSLPDLLKVPKKKDNKKYNTLAMNYLVKLQQGQAEQNGKMKPIHNSNNNFSNNDSYY